MNIIEYLESKGYADQFLTVAKAKVFVKLNSYEKALENFQKALGETSLYTTKTANPLNKKGCK